MNLIPRRCIQCHGRVDATARCVKCGAQFGAKRKTPKRFKPFNMTISRVEMAMARRQVDKVT